MQRTIEGLFVDDGGVNVPGELPVVFAHSAAGSTDQWSAQLSHLRETRRAVALDLRGHGQSQPPSDGDYSMQAMASDIGQVSDALGLSRFILIGHSMGGAVALAHAAARPARVAGLLLLDAASDGRAMPAEQKLGILQALRSSAYRPTIEAYWDTLLVGSSPRVRQYLLSQLARTREQTVVESLAALFEFDPVTALANYPGPRLSVVTRCNETPAAYHRLVATLPHRAHEGTGHWLQLDAPERVNALIDEFLRMPEFARG
jgi:pimeloyl-ACP methyl ester carboxylesterase